jgi:hypothetical protein
MQLANMRGSSASSGGGDDASNAEWLRLFDSVEGALEEAQADYNDAQHKGIGNRQKRNIGKKGQHAYNSACLPT